MVAFQGFIVRGFRHAEADSMFVPKEKRFTIW